MPTSSTTLAHGPINGGDTITIELIQPADMPAVVRIVWPPQPTVVRPDAYPDCAPRIMRVVARASIELAAIKARRL